MVASGFRSLATPQLAPRGLTTNNQHGGTGAPGLRGMPLVAHRGRPQPVGEESLPPDGQPELRGSAGRVQGTGVATLLLVAVVLGQINYYPFLASDDYSRRGILVPNGILSQRSFFYEDFGLMSPVRASWPAVRAQRETPPEAVYGTLWRPGGLMPWQAPSSICWTPAA